MNYVFRTKNTINIEDLFNRDAVTTGETDACFHPLKEIINRATLPVRACPLASLLVGFADMFDASEFQMGREVVQGWHNYRGSQFVGNISDEAPKHGRWIWRNSNVLHVTKANH